MCGLGQAQFDAMVEEGYQASLTWHQGAFCLAQSTPCESFGVSCLQARIMHSSMDQIMYYSVSRADLGLFAPNLCCQGC